MKISTNSKSEPELDVQNHILRKLNCMVKFARQTLTLKEDRVCHNLTKPSIIQGGPEQMIKQKLKQVIWRINFRLYAECLKNLWTIVKEFTCQNTNDIDEKKWTYVFVQRWASFLSKFKSFNLNLQIFHKPTS